MVILGTEHKRYIIFECGLRNLYGRLDTAIVYDTTIQSEKITEWKKLNPNDVYHNPAIVRTFVLDAAEGEKMYKSWMKKHQGEFSWL